MDGFAISRICESIHFSDLIVCLLSGVRFLCYSVQTSDATSLGDLRVRVSVDTTLLLVVSERKWIVRFYTFALRS